VGAAITGGMGGGQEQAPAQQDYTQQQPYYPGGGQAVGSAPCQMEIKQFLDCAQSQYDITLCQGFNEALRQCRISNGQYQMDFSGHFRNHSVIKFILTCATVCCGFLIFTVRCSYASTMLA